MKFDWILIFPLLAFINSIPALNCRSLKKLHKSLDRLGYLSGSKYQQQKSRTSLANDSNDSIQPCDALPDAKRLYDDLLRKSGYSPAVRPIRRYGNNVTVEMGIALEEIEDLEERAGRLAYRFQFRFLWNDYQLAWEPSEYGGVREIDMIPSQIWTPDIDLYNNVESIVKRDIKARVYSNGDVLWMPTGHFKSSCKHEIRTDTWKCPLLFRSWVHTASEVDIAPFRGDANMDLEEVRHNPHWVIVETKGEKVMKRFSCCGDVLFPGMEYLLTVRNKIGHPALLGRRRRSIRDFEF